MDGAGRGRRRPGGSKQDAAASLSPTLLALAMHKIHSYRQTARRDVCLRLEGKPRRSLNGYMRGLKHAL